MEVVSSPCYATAAGLALYGSSMAEVVAAREEAREAGWFERVKRFITDNF